MNYFIVKILHKSIHFVSVYSKITLIPIILFIICPGSLFLMTFHRTTRILFLTVLSADHVWLGSDNSGLLLQSQELKLELDSPDGSVP